MHLLSLPNIAFRGAALRQTLHALATALCAALSASAMAAEPPAVVTLIEGRTASLQRGKTRQTLTEGTRLQSGDVIEVGDAALTQIEFSDGVIVSLGPKSRFHVTSLVARGANDKGVSDFQLAQGWSKFRSGKTAAPFRYATPLFGFHVANATAVIHTGNKEGNIFVETGELRITEQSGAAPSADGRRVRSEEFYTRKADQRGAIQPRIPNDFLAAIPKAYLDNLPTRIGLYKDSTALGPVNIPYKDPVKATYKDVETWLKNSPEILHPIMGRSAAQVDEATLREALIENVGAQRRPRQSTSPQPQNAEWGSILLSDKYSSGPSLKPR